MVFGPAKPIDDYGAGRFDLSSQRFDVLVQWHAEKSETRPDRMAFSNRVVTPVPCHSGATGKYGLHVMHTGPSDPNRFDIPHTADFRGGLLPVRLFKNSTSMLGCRVADFPRKKYCGLALIETAFSISETSPIVPPAA